MKMLCACIKICQTQHGPAHMDGTSSLFSFRSAFSKHKLLVKFYSNNRLNQ